MRKSNYDKTPSTRIEGKIWIGWSEILNKLKKTGVTGDFRKVFVVECYQGVNKQELLSYFKELSPTLLIDTENLFKSPEDIERMTAPYMTEDSLFGYTSHFSYKNFLDTEIRTDSLFYADMEQQRFILTRTYLCTLIWHVGKYSNASGEKK